ncbi:hypothetical protein CYY_000097 [Polysphondylium violaceum]|uniref:Gamete and mating-type specific protein A n=1 Tax=Polysphondylium violaceum TaxID=133409 RepID=A0A8J4Q5A6_9MYCE|nr:hypothetical protein CYY_000097 [Polysphondylium violaceum]
MVKPILYLTVLIGILACAVIADFTSNEQKNLQDGVNNLRATTQPNALGTWNQMTWDVNAYTNAMSQAQNCQKITYISRLGAAGYYGESNTWFQSDPSTQDLLDSLSSSSNNYNYDDTQCEKDDNCIPYTNLIWNATTKFGCYKNQCDGGYLVTCNFYPAGSFSGVKPYEARAHTDVSRMSYSDGQKWVDLDGNLKDRYPYDDDRVYTATVPNQGSFDWRNEDIVGYPEDSTNCAAGWAYTAAGIYETRIAMRKKERYNLSKQMLIDCIPFNGKCSVYGGDLNRALIWIQNNGLYPASLYPWTASSTSQCRGNDTNLYAVNGGDIEASLPGRDAIVEKAREQGPVGVGLYAPIDLFNYRQGVFECNNTALLQPGNNVTINHNVLLVGYNEKDNYYIIRNSWGRSWGENGFGRISADPNKDCLIGQNAAWSVQI